MGARADWSKLHHHHSGSAGASLQSKASKTPRAKSPNLQCIRDSSAGFHWPVITGELQGRPKHGCQSRLVQAASPSFQLSWGQLAEAPPGRLPFCRRFMCNTYQGLHKCRVDLALIHLTAWILFPCSKSTCLVDAIFPDEATHEIAVALQCRLRYPRATDCVPMREADSGPFNPCWPSFTI